MLLSKPDLVRMAVKTAQDLQFPPAMLCSFIDVMSAWNPGKTEYIPMPYLPTFESDLERQMASIRWGLMQIQGEYARQNGFEGELLHLLDPETNLHCGCKILVELMTQSQGREPDALLRWNNARDEQLVYHTMARVQLYEAFLKAMPKEN